MEHAAGEKKANFEKIERFASEAAKQRAPMPGLAAIREVHQAARGQGLGGEDIAAVVNAEGNVLGLMPHPEHAVDTMLGSGDGGLILASLVGAARERSYTRA